MKEIYVDTDEVRLYENEEMIKEVIGAEMKLSDFDIGDIGVALALYKMLCEMEDDEAIIKFS